MKHTRTLFFALALLLSAPVQMHAQEVEQPQVVTTQSQSLAAVLAQLNDIAASAGIALPDALTALINGSWNPEDAQQQFEAAAAALEQVASQEIVESAAALVADLKLVLEQTYAELISYESSDELEPTSKKAKEVFCTVFIKNLLNVCGNLFVNGKVTINPRPGSSNTLVLEVNGNTNIDGNITVNTITIREGVIEDTGQFVDLIVENSVTVESFDNGVVQSDVNGLLFSSTNITEAEQLSLPATASNTVGVININGSPVLHAFGGDSNIFLGTDAGNFATADNQLTGVGAFTLLNNSTGVNNTALGTNVLLENTTGSDNTGVGVSALESNVTGNNNTAVGSSALFDVDSGSNNVAVGAFALLQNDTGSNNTAVGFEAARSTEGSDNTAVGYVALRNTTTGTANVAVGTRAFLGNVTGDNSTFVGFEAGVAASATGITAVGYRAAANTGVDFITAVGFNALTANSTGDRNTAVGASALAANTDGEDNAAFGYQAMLSNTLGTRNTAVGVNALSSNIDGLDNVAIGFNTLAATQNVSNLVAVGSRALQANTTGANNTAVGFGCLDENTTGNNNTGLGFEALESNVSGANNTALGRRALNQLVSGNGNIAIGNEAGTAYDGGQGGNIVIGAPGLVGDSGVIRIGTLGTQSANFQAGIYNAPAADPGSNLAVAIDNTGKLNTAAVPSSARFKENIKTLDVEMVGKMMQLRPVEFNYISDSAKKEQWGLIAEEVEQILPQLVSYDKDGVIYTVKYAMLPAMLLHMIQQQNKRLEDQQQQIDQLRAQLSSAAYV